MKTPEQIINEIRSFISETRPFKFARSGEVILNSLTELENVLSPSEAIIEEPVVEVIEEPVVEEPVVEEPTIEESIVAKRGAKKK